MIPIRDLKKRTYIFAEKSVELLLELPKTITNQELGRQYIQASTSIGANYREADGADSAKEFVYKIGIIKKEVKESLYWLGLLQSANKSNRNINLKIDWLIQEAKELVLIFSKISINVKAKL